MVKNSSVLKKSLKSFNDMPRVTKLLSLLVLLIVFVSGFYMGQADNFSPLGGSIGSPSFQQKEAYKDGYKKALDFARKKIEDKGLISQNPMPPINIISNATVQSVSGNQINIKFDASQIDILGEGTVSKDILIPENVKIEKRTYKSQDEAQQLVDKYRQEEEEYRQSVANGENPEDRPTLPVMYTSQNVNISDLKSGDKVNVFYQPDANNPDVLNAMSVELVK